MKKTITLILSFVLFTLYVNGQHKSEGHTDGIEPYYETESAINYVKTVDKSYLPYLKASNENIY